jgi:hypothetical protein
VTFIRSLSQTFVVLTGSTGVLSFGSVVSIMYSLLPFELQSLLAHMGDRSISFALFSVLAGCCEWGVWRLLL